MSTRRTLILATGALVAGLVAGGFVTSRFYQRQLNQFATDSAAAAVGSAHSALHRLRAGRTNDAIALLEIELEGHMLALQSMLEEVPHRGRNTNSIRLLERARAYRAAHPREARHSRGRNEESMTTPPNHALQRTRHGVAVCNPHVPLAGSLSLGR